VTSIRDLTGRKHDLQTSLVSLLGSIERAVGGVAASANARNSEL